MKNLLMKHKRKIGVVFMLFVLAFFFMKSTPVLARNNNMCTANDEATLDYNAYVTENAFGLTLDPVSGASDRYKITMSPDPEDRDLCNGQSFRLKSVNGSDWSSRNLTLTCDNAIEFTSGTTTETDSGLDGVIVELVGEVGKTVNIFSDGNGGYCYANVTVKLEYSVGTITTHSSSCPSYTATVDTSSVSGIDCSAPRGDFETAFCSVKGAAQGTANDKTSEIRANGGKLSDHNIVFKCNYQLEGANKLVPSVIEHNEGDAYFVNHNYLYGSYSFRVNNGNYNYEYTPGTITTGDAISCEVKCEEAVEVEYGPPVASRAGACFEYKVRVTSRVSCNMSSLPNPPQANCNYCDPRPYCRYGSQIFQQGGPNEDYDQCIKSCDGGKYTKKCSKKCYQEVYSSNVIAGAKIKSDSLDLSATKLAAPSNNGPKEQEVRDCINNYSLPNTNSNLKRCYCIGKVYGVDDHNQYGCYFGSGNNITWKGVKFSSSDCRLASGDKTTCRGVEGRYYTNHPGGRYHNGQYILPAAKNDGFWRHVYNTAAGYCTDNCQWLSCGTNVYMNDGFAEKDYFDNMERYAAAISSCRSRATCSTTTSEYTISADYKAKGSDSVQTFNFPNYDKDTITHSGGTVSGTFGDNNTTILSDYPETNEGRLGCYRNGDPEPRLYRSTWSFPGSWRNIKTAEISFDPSVGTNAWRKIPGKFCIPIDAKGVNVEWWNKYNSISIASDPDPDVRNALTGGSIQSEPAEACKHLGSLYENNYHAYNVTDDDVTWNIHANTKKFGYFGWNIQMDCFYAINTAPSVFVDDSGDTTPDPCVGNDEHPYTIRTVDLDNVFPSEAADADESATRTPGFNWSQYATLDSNHNANYTSSPAEYLESVQTAAQSEGKEYYNNNRLDYEFVLQPSQLRAIRAQSQSHASYGDFPDSQFSVVNGISRYQSDLIRDASLVGSSVKLPNDSALKCNNMKNYSESGCDTVHNS